MAAFAPREETTRLVKETADLVEIIGGYVNLKRSGANFKGLCPFHAEKTPSFVVNPARRSFHCFGCGEGGDVFSFLMKYRRLSFPEALRELAALYNIYLPEKALSPEEKAKGEKRAALQSINRQAAEIFHRHLLHDSAAEPARLYLEKRGMDREIIAAFRLGYAPGRWDFLAQELRRLRVSAALAMEAGLLLQSDKGRIYDRFRNRIMFPIVDLQGEIAGFGGRLLGEGQPKYLNTPETPIYDKGRTLFGLHQNREAIRAAGQCLLVEGNFDLLALVAHGFKNVAAPLGTALTLPQVRIIKGYADNVILLFDGDSAGLKAAVRAAPLLLSEHLTARVAVLPEGHDPDSFVRKQGAAALTSFLTTATPLPEFICDRLIAEHGLTVEGKSRILEEMAPLLRAGSLNAIQQSVLVAHVGQKLELLPEEVLSALRETPGGRRGPGRPKGAAAVPAQEKRYLEFLLVSPEYFEPFEEAGIDEAVRSAIGRTILAHMKRQWQGTTPSPRAFLLGSLADCPEGAFVTEILTTTPAFSEEIKTSMAEEMLVAIKKMRLKREKELLLARIKEAQQANDVARCKELLVEKMAMDRVLASE